MALVRLPERNQRIAIVGSTGSGKTYAALEHLSLADIEDKPWIIVDFKRDDVIQEIPYTIPMDVDAKIPTRPGIYKVQPKPWEDGVVDGLLMRVWERGDTGIYVDEGHMLDPRGDGLRAVITQGRSKNIPLIHLSQRPKWVSKYVATEPEFHRVFRLQDPDDIAFVRKFTDKWIFRNRETGEDIYLPEFHSYYHDVARHQTNTMPPGPDLQELLERFDQRLAKKKRFA